jgi:hypothetical protein
MTAPRFTRSLFVGLIHCMFSYEYLRICIKCLNSLKISYHLNCILFTHHSSLLPLFALILFFSYELIPRLLLFCFAQYANESPAGYLARGILYSLRKVEANASQLVTKTIRIGL